MSVFNRKFLISLTILLMISGCAVKKNNWEMNYSLEHARFAHAAVSDGKSIYVLGGANESGFLGNIEVIDPASSKTKVLENKIIPRRYISAVWDGADSIYIIGGVSLINNRLKFERRVEVFNINTGEVSYVRAMPFPARSNAAVYLNGRIYVMGGTLPRKNRAKVSSRLYIYDIKQDKWTPGADMPMAKETRAVVYKNAIYAVGGYNYKSSLNVFEKYNPRKDKWMPLPKLPFNVSAHSVIVKNDELYVFGDYKHMNLAHKFDFDLNQWQVINGFNASRHNAAAMLNDAIYVIGGNLGPKGPFLKDIQIFR